MTVVEECMLVGRSLAEALYQTRQSYNQESCRALLEGHGLVVEGCKKDADGNVSVDRSDPRVQPASRKSVLGF